MRSDLAWAALGFLGIGIVIFWRYLFGDELLLYRDIGNDSLTSYYPDFVHLSHYVRTTGFPSWSFHVGMGQDIAYAVGYLIWEPVSWLPRQWIAHALVYQHLFKVVLAGVIFAHYLQLRGLHSPSPFLGGLLLACSAYMTMGSCWYPLADEVICFPAVLLGVEKALKGRHWLWLALPVALIGTINPFFLYLCALLLAVYVPVRLFECCGLQPRLIIRASLFLGVIAVLAVASAAVITFPYLNVILNSPRGSGDVSSGATLQSFPIFGLESRLHYATALLRTFANDGIGTASDFHGWANYLEAPLNYCGLICLLLLPQAFAGMTQRQRLIYGSFVTAALLLTLFPWFRYLFWAFQGDYYRTYSLFCVLLAIGLGMRALSRYAGGQPLNLILLAATLVGFLVLLCLPFDEIRTGINPTIRRAGTVYLLVYSAVLAGGQLLKQKRVAVWLLVGLTAIELVQFNRITISDRQTIAKQDLIDGIATEHKSDAALKVARQDSDTFFRITRLRGTEAGAEASLNDPMLFHYYGTTWSGSFNHVNYTAFLTAVGAIPPQSELHTRWAIGVAGNFLLSIFAGEKYLIVENPKPFEKAPQYELLGRYGDDYLLRNNLALPFGLIFTDYVPEDVFREFSNEIKEQLLPAVAVLPGKEFGLTEMTLPDLRQKMTSTSFPELIEERRRTALSPNSFSQTALAGTVHLDRKSLLVVQTPFDRGWRAWADGARVPTLKVDAGLLGVSLQPGEHKIELRYRNPLLITGAIVSSLAIVLIAIGAVRWPRLGLSR